MKFKKEMLLLYAVTDRHWTGRQTLEEQIEEALAGGVTILQLREKNLPEEEFLQEAIRVKEICHRHGVPLIINDNVEVALKSGADGVHVGQSDMEAGMVREKIGPDKILGVSAQTVEQAIQAQKQGADYLGVGAVFHTGSKDDADDVSYETLKAICQAVSIPVVAIGGITRENVKELAGSGICGVAVISAIYAADHIEKAARDLKEATREMLCQ